MSAMMFVSTGASAGQRRIDPERDFNRYVESLRQYDVYITLPENYSPVDTRGNRSIEQSFGAGTAVSSIDWRYALEKIKTVIENDSCTAAICFPETELDRVQEFKERVILPDSVLKTFNPSGSRMLLRGKGIEADMRLNHQDRYMDVRPYLTVIAQDDMSQYANADTVVIYEMDNIRAPYMDIYPCAVGIYLRKKAHPSLLIRVALNLNSFKDKDRYIRQVLDNVRYGDNPADILVEAEKQVSKMSDFPFPSHYRSMTGILPDVNDETLEEINRVKAWCEAHGLDWLPKLDDESLDALNRHKAFKDKQFRDADSLFYADIPSEDKVFWWNVLETQPGFPGGSMHTWITQNLKYPKSAVKRGVSGSVSVNFTVTDEGYVKDPVLSEWDKDKDADLCKEAVRLIKSMPRWTPATYRGKAVNTTVSAPVHFRLDSNGKPVKPYVAPQPIVPDTVSSDDPDVMSGYVSDMSCAIETPKFPGGNDLVIPWIAEHIKYPAEAAENNIEGKVMVEFIIARDGSVRKPRVIKGVNESLDKEALRVISVMPRWAPGKRGDNPVVTRYVCPVVFKL